MSTDTSNLNPVIANALQDGMGRAKCKQAIELGFLANGGREFDARSCECDPDVGAVPCRYCSIHRALVIAEGLVEGRTP